MLISIVTYTIDNIYLSKKSKATKIPIGKLQALRTTFAK